LGASCWQEKIDKAQEKKDGLNDDWDALIETRGEARAPSEAVHPPGTAVKDVVGKPAEAAPATPSEDAIRGYKKAVATFGKEVADQAWATKYGVAPPKGD